MNRRPLAFLYLSALLGAFFGAKLTISPLFYGGLIISFILLLILRNLTIKTVLFLSFTFLLTLTVTKLERHRYETILSHIPQHEAIFTGIVLDVAQRSDGTISVMALVQEPGEKNQFRFRINLIEQLAHRPPNIGALIRFKGLPRPYAKPLSPMYFDELSYGLAHNIHGAITVRDHSSYWQDGKDPQGYFAKLKALIIHRIMAVLSPYETSLLLALMIGSTQGLQKSQIDVFKEIGAQHLLAVSGLQVTIFVAIGFFLLMPLCALLLPHRFLHRAAPLTSILTIAMGFWFIGLSGFSASAVRALLMASIVLLPYFIARKIDLFDSFFLSGLITILMAPLSILDLGYLLSYAAVFGLLVAHSRSTSLRGRLRHISPVFSFSISLIMSSTAAFLATLPIIVLAIGTVAPFAIITNIVLVPIATILQIPAILLGLAGALFNGPALIMLASYFSNAIEILAQVLNQLFGSLKYIPAWPKPILMLSLVGIMLLFLCILKMNRALLITAGVALMVPFSWFFVRIPMLEIVVIPIGQGDATLFSLPSGQKILVDAGGHMYGNFDPGERIIVPTLKSKGVTELDILVITHPDPDHILGAFAVLSSIPVKEIWHNGLDQDHPLTKRLCDAALTFNIPVKEAKDILGNHRFGDTTIQIISPDYSLKNHNLNTLSTNDKSIVLRIIHGNTTLMWPGDIEKAGEELLLASKKDLSATILKAPHHGSKTSSSNDFITAVNPIAVIYSTGKNNRFNHPHQEVQEKFRARGVSQWNTAQHGELTITVTKEDFSIEGFIDAS